MDIDGRRLEKARPRFRRAGVSDIIEVRPLDDERSRKWLKRQKGTFDPVLVDVPCTGSGTWRRNPDAKWRLKEEDVTELAALQAEILDSAQRLVKPGGRLIYATCSLLMEENEDQIVRFLETHPDFAALPVASVWAETLEGECPARADTLRLSPVRNGTDGFFVAVMARKPAATKTAPPEAETGDK